MRRNQPRHLRRTCRTHVGRFPAYYLTVYTSYSIYREIGMPLAGPYWGVLHPTQEALRCVDTAEKPTQSMAYVNHRRVASYTSHLRHVAPREKTADFRRFWSCIPTPDGRAPDTPGASA